MRGKKNIPDGEKVVKAFVAQTEKNHPQLDDLDKLKLRHFLNEFVAQWKEKLLDYHQ